MSATGNVLEHVSDHRGIATIENNQFELVLEDICGNWLAAHPNSPLLLSGMIGSRQGWIEAPYCPCPCALETIHQHAVALPSARLTGYVVPGLIASGLSGAPDVMRGEETQIAGLTALQPGLTGTVCLPGSHSKWVSLRNNRIEGFSTFLTGELFANSSPVKKVENPSIRLFRSDTHLECEPGRQTVPVKPGCKAVRPAICVSSPRITSGAPERPDAMRPGTT